MRKTGMTVLFALTFVFGFAASGFAASPIDSITFFTEEYPPFNMAGPDGKPAGVSVEILEEIFKRTGSSLTTADVQIVPWARGYKDVQEKKNICLFSMTQTEERLPNFKWVGPILVSTFDAIALKSKGLKGTTKEDLVNLKAGVIREDMGEILAKQYGIKHFEPTATIESNVKKLNAGRIDIWIFSNTSLKMQLDKMGLNADDYESIYQMSESRLFFAFNKNADDTVINEMQKALDDMKADGTYKSLMDKYGLQ